jgi:hypothetical protein
MRVLGSAGILPAVSRASRDRHGNFSAGAPKRAGEAPALPELTFSAKECSVSAQKFRGGHSPLSFQLHFGKRERAFASSHD